FIQTLEIHTKSSFYVLRFVLLLPGRANFYRVNGVFALSNKARFRPFCDVFSESLVLFGLASRESFLILDPNSLLTSEIQCMYGPSAPPGTTGPIISLFSDIIGASFFALL